MKITRSNLILLSIFTVTLLMIIANFLRILYFPENKEILRIEEAFPTMETGDYPKTKPMTLYADNTVTQKIKTEKNNFGQINVAFENFPADIRDNIIFVLGDENCNPIYEKDLNAFSYWLATDTIYTRLKFPVQRDSAGKTYCLQFTSKLPGARTQNSPRISTFRSENDSVFNAAYYGKNYERESLVFKSVYLEDSVWTRMNILLDRMSQYKPWFFKGVLLAIIFILFILATILTTVLFVIFL